MISTLILLATYAIVIVASQSYAGVGSTGIGLANPANSGDVHQFAGLVGLRHLGDRVVHGQAAAADGAQLGGGVDADHHSADGTDDVVDGGLQGDPEPFGKVHKRFLTPTTSTVAMGAVSIVLYVAMNYLSNGSSVIGDSVAALGAMIAFYYGLTGFACVWYYRKSLTESAREPLAARHPPPARWPHPLVLHGVVHLVQLGHPEQQLHHLDLPGHAPGDRRRLRPHRRLLRCSASC